MSPADQLLLREHQRPRERLEFSRDVESQGRGLRHQQSRFPGSSGTENSARAFRFLNTRSDFLTVAAGLALIIARIALRKSNEWLSSANLLTLSLTLYACCFINFTATIANYNVDHSLEMTGQAIRA